jgi:HPt (histidine-containing phosphotransfer) domain-containing protein
MWRNGDTMLLDDAAMGRRIAALRGLSAWEFPPMTGRSFAAQLAEDLGPDDVLLVLSVFEADLARLIAVIATAAQAGDSAAFRRGAHGLAGAAGAVGAYGLEAACREAMTQADAPARALAVSFEHINALAELARGELAAFVGQASSPG